MSSLPMQVALMLGETIEKVRVLRSYGTGWTSRILQQLLLTMLTDRDSQRKVSEAIVQYADRRSAMVKHLAAQGVRVRGSTQTQFWR